MKTKKHLLPALVILSAAFLFTGCNYPARSTPSPVSEMDLLYTVAAQTVQVEMTQNAVSTTPTIMPTVIFPTPTLIPPLPTATSLPPSPTSGVVFPTATTYFPPATVVAIPCNRAQFIKDVTVADGTVYSPGVKFTKIWQVKNIGSCDWTTQYRLAFVNGNRLNAPASIKLPGRIRVGESVNLEAPMQAPDNKGRYTGNWMLVSASGSRFGVGANSSTPLVVDIRVEPPPNLGYSYDFSAVYCAASWRSREGKVACPTITSLEDGAITRLNNPTLENDRKENEETLWFRPDRSNNGYLTGTYPAYKVKNGDHFLADIGCLQGYKGCDITFYLDYIQSDGQVKNLGSWHEVYDGKITRLNIDLSSLDGQQLQFVLGVKVNKNPSQANGFWLVPSIRPGTPLPSVTPTRTSTTTSPSTLTPTPTPTATPTGTPTATPTVTPSPNGSPSPTPTETETPASTDG